VSFEQATEIVAALEAAGGLGEGDCAPCSPRLLQRFGVDANRIGSIEILRCASRTPATTVATCTGRCGQSPRGVASAREIADRPGAHPDILFLEDDKTSRSPSKPSACPASTLSRGGWRQRAANGNEPSAPSRG
jgi:hypothetical protein